MASELPDMSTDDRLIPSLHLLQRTLRTDLAYTVARLKVLESIPGNPMGVAYRWIDENTAGLMARHLPLFNRVVGLRGGHERHVEPLIDWYRQHSVEPTFEMVPGLFDPSLGRELARLGFFQSGFHAALITEPDQAEPIETPIDIERVLTPKLMEQYLDAYVAGWGVANEHHAQFKANVRPWLDQAGWSLYLARINGQPAAAATLYVYDRVGYLADAATDPSFRGRGLQLALIRRRIRDAHAAGVDFVFSGAHFLASSHRNMERAGMRVQFLRAKWTPT